MTVKDIFKEEFDALKKEITDEYIRLKMKASGQFEDELEVQVDESSGKLLGAFYAEQLEHGRRPTSGSGDGSLLKAIKQWVVDKGIVARIRGDISVSSLAFLITRKIHRDGWKREEHGGVNLVSNVVTEKRMQQIIDRIGESMTITLALKLEKELNTIMT